MTKRIVQTLCLAIALTACSGPMVQVKHDRSIRFETLKTYAWKLTANPLGEKLSQDPTLDLRIRSVIDHALTARGLQAVPEQNAELFLDYSVSAEEKVDAMRMENYATAEFYGLTYTLGTLNLLMRRSTSPAVIWDGSVYANIDATKPPEEREARLREAVEGLLKKFPPK